MEAISECFNHAFSDYQIPLSMSKDQLLDKFQHEGGRLDLSVGVFEKNQMVGFILHFVEPFFKGYKVYNGGTGVIPSHRGQQLTLRMYEYLFPKLKEFGAATITLEVIETNFKAIAVYEMLGFKNIRTVNCYKGKIKVPEAPSISPGLQIKAINELPWELFHSFWDHAPTWQNGTMVMRLREAQLNCTALFEDAKALGYVIYNPKMKRIHQLAVDHRYRNRGVASTLLAALSIPDIEELSVLNIDSSNKGLCRLMEKFGLNKTVSQYEMVLPIYNSYRSSNL